MSAARGLAFELSQLAPAQREQLLAELPDERRIELEALLQEIAGLLSPPAGMFERHLEAAVPAPPADPLAGLNDGQLRLLLSAEHPSVQHRIAAAAHTGRIADFAPAVAAIVTDYLTARLQTSEMRGERPRASARWRLSWRRASR